METIAYHVIIGCWLAFLAYWLISAWRGKAVAERLSRAVIWRYKLPCMLGGVAAVPPESAPATLLGADSFLLCGRHNSVRDRPGGGRLGAPYAGGQLEQRRHLQAGPRTDHDGSLPLGAHPIYTALLLMAVGTALAGGLIHYWLGCLFFLIGFWIKLWQEEEVMRRQFPDAYPAYARRVKALVPYLL